MHQDCQLLVWQNLKPREPFEMGTLGEVTAQRPTQLCPASTLFEALHIENFPKRHGGFPTNLVSWSI